MKEQGSNDICGLCISTKENMKKIRTKQIKLKILFYLFIRVSIPGFMRSMWMYHDASVVPMHYAIQSDVDCSFWGASLCVPNYTDSSQKQRNWYWQQNAVHAFCFVTIFGYKHLPASMVDSLARFTHQTENLLVFGTWGVFISDPVYNTSFEVSVFALLVPLPASAAMVSPAPDWLTVVSLYPEEKL